MNKTPTLALLVAASMTLGTATTIAPTIAGAAETQTPTMADTHNPYVDDITFHRAEQSSDTARIKLDKPLPDGTTLTLLDANVTDTLRSDNGVLFSFRDGKDYQLGQGYITYKYILAQQSGDGRYKDTGNTTTARILFQYPDGSQDIAEATLTIIPTIAQVNGATYPRTTMAPGETITSTPTLTTPRAAGTQFALIQASEATELHEKGWDISIDSTTGSLTVTSPDVNATAQIPVLANYPDGTSQTIEVHITSTLYVEAPAPSPNNDKAFGSSSS